MSKGHFKRAIMAAMDGGAPTDVTKSAMVAIEVLVEPFVIEVEEESPGRWLAHIPACEVMAHGDTRELAIASVVAMLPFVEIREAS